ANGADGRRRQREIETNERLFPADKRRVAAHPTLTPDTLNDARIGKLRRELRERACRHRGGGKRGAESKHERHGCDLDQDAAATPKTGHSLTHPREITIRAIGSRDLPHSCPREP